MKLIFATNNQHKVDEIRSVLGDPGITIISLKEAGINIDIPEPHDTLEANASEKSWTIYRLAQANCFSEDTGLEVAALNGAPGVRSARYAGDITSFDRNIEKLLRNMAGITQRNARFRTVISLIIDGIETQFEGICNGTIVDSKVGNGGFGYDPIFVPEGSIHTFAEMDMQEKNRYSHRQKAVSRLAAYLNQLNQKSKN